MGSMEATFSTYEEDLRVRKAGPEPAEDQDHRGEEAGAFAQEAHALADLGGAEVLTRKACGDEDHCRGIGLGGFLGEVF